MKPNNVAQAATFVAYDAVFEHKTHGHWLLDFTPAVLLAAALVTAYYRPEIGRRTVPEGRLSS